MAALSFLIPELTFWRSLNFPAYGQGGVFGLDYSRLLYCTAAFSNYMRVSAIALERRKVLRQPRSAGIGPAHRASRPEVVNKKRPKDEYLMYKKTKTTATKRAGSPKQDAPQAFREMAEKGTTQAYEKMNAATTEAADQINNSYSTAVKGVQDYNNKFIEFAHANTNAAFDLVQKLSGVKSAFEELWTEHARKQVETLTEQSKQLAALGQKVTRATAEPFKTGVSNLFNIAA